MVAKCFEPASLPTSFEFRLRFAHRIVEVMQREQKYEWDRNDLGTLLLETLEEEFELDWSQPNAIEKFKEYLALAYVAAGSVLQPSQRTF